MSSVRRLTAILAADVAGYSRLMGADEEGIHARLKAHLGALVNPRIGEHRGRIVKNTGDGFLAEFSSVVDALRCGVEVQRGMAEGNTPPEKRIEFRIGINLGDVILAPRSRPARRPGTVILLKPRAAQAGEAVLIESSLPGPVFLLGQVVPTQRLFEGDAAAAHGSDQRGLAVHGIGMNAGDIVVEDGDIP